MKRFLGFVKKEFLHIYRDKRTLIILFGMPLVQILLFGFAITNEIRDAHIAVLDMSQDQVTREIKDRIFSTKYFIQDEDLNSPADIERSFQKGKVKLVVVFPENFAGDLTKNHTANIQLISDATDPNTGTTITNYLRQIIFSYQTDLNKDLPNPLMINPEVRMVYNPELKGAYLFVPGLITIILMLVCAMMTSISITKEIETGTMELLLSSPMKASQVIIAKVIPYMSLSFLISMFILVLGKFVFKVPINGSLPLLLFETLLFILVALSLGVLISTVAKNQQTALMMSLMGLMLPSIILSGFIYPIENMPLPLQIISNVIPAKWFIIIVKDIMLKGSGISIFFKENLILAGFLVFFILLSIRRYKVRLQ